MLSNFVHCPRDLEGPCYGIYTNGVIVNKLHRKKVVGRWSADHLPTTYRPPTNHLLTTTLMTAEKATKLGHDQVMCLCRC